MTEKSVKWHKQRRSTLALVLLPLAVFLGLIGLFFSSFVMRETGVITNPDQVPSVLVNKPAPDFKLPVLEKGETNGSTAGLFATEDLRGKISIVNIWASWCVPCRVEHPFLMELSRDNRIQVFGLNYKDKPENALNFLDELGNPYKKVGIDKNGRVGIDWGVYGVPETYIVGSNGVIRYKFIGPLTRESFRSTFMPNLENVILDET